MLKKWWEVPSICLLMAVLAIVSTYPLVHYFDTGIPYDSYKGGVTWNRTGDQMQLLYWFWLVKENLLGTVPFDTNPFEFNMIVPHETTGFTTFPLAFLFFIFSPFGDIVAYNCTILSTYVLAGTFMYLLVRLYSGSRTGALLAAIIFTFAPSRINGITGGNAYGFLFFLYPWILYFLEKGIRAEKIRYGILSGIGLIALSMIEAHLLYYICIFLAIFIPLRLIVAFPAKQQLFIDISNSPSGLFAWSVPRSLLIVWGAGIAAVFYSQILFFCRDQSPFYTKYFWWIFAAYPIILVLVSLCFAVLFSRLTPLGFRRSFAVEAGSLLPLYFLVPISFVTCVNPLDTGVVVTSAAGIVIAAKLFLLRKHLHSILNVLVTGLVGCKKIILIILPVVCSMGYVIFWIPLTKTTKLAPTIAANGRTLQDVKLYSSDLSDVFSQMSNVYIGIVPAVIVGLFLTVSLWSLLFKGRPQKFRQDSELIVLFYVFVAFSSYILSLGLAFGRSSLYLFLYYYLPYFNYPRVSDRIIVLTLFATAIVVGFLVQKMQQRYTGLWFGVVTMIAVFAAAWQLKDYNVFKPTGITVLDKGQAVYTHVRKNVEDGVLLEIPLWPGDSHQSSLYQHYIMQDRIPRINGYSPLVRKDYIDTVFGPLSTLNMGRLDNAQYELLQKLGVEYITVHDNRDVFPEKVSPFSPLTTVRRFKNSPFLDLVDIKNSMHFKDRDIVNDNVYLFKVKGKESVIFEDEELAWYEMPNIYSVGNRLLHQTGEVAEDRETGNKIIMAAEDKHQPGFLVYGPYSYYAPGKYRCYFFLNSISGAGSQLALAPSSANKNSEKIARVEVVTTVGDKQTVLTQEELKEVGGDNLYQRVYLDFILQKAARLEFRVFYYGIGTVRVQKIVVYRQNHHEPLYYIEAEKMVGEIGQLEFDNEASSGKVIEAIAGKNNKRGEMVYGPNRRYGKGQYRASYYLRKKDLGSTDMSNIIANLSISDGQNFNKISERRVLANELSKDDFTGIEVDFELTHAENLSFHLEFTNEISLQLDRIEIEKIDKAVIHGGAEKKE